MSICLDEGVCRKELERKAKELEELSLEKVFEKTASARQSSGESAELGKPQLVLESGNLAAPMMPSLLTAPCFLLVDENCEVCRMLNLDQSWVRFKDWLLRSGIPILSMRVIEELNLTRFKKLLEKHRVIERTLDWRTFEIRESYYTPVLVCEEIAYEFKLEIRQNPDKPPLNQFIENRYELMRIKDMIRIAKAIVRYHCEKYGGCTRYIYYHEAEESEKRGRGRSGGKGRSKKKEVLAEMEHGLGLLKNLTK